MKSFLEKFRLWVYRVSLVAAVVFLIGFSIVLPIDCIAQAAESSNTALNTFIVVGALVAFAVACIVIVVGRIIFYKSCRQHIPRWYLPLASADLPHRGSRKMVLENVDRCRELSILFKRSKDPVIHAGLEPPVRCDSKDHEKIFPEYLNYQSCIKSLADRLKYQGVFLNNTDLKMELNETFSDVVKNQFIKDTDDEFQIENAQKFIDIYEAVRFSDKEVTRSQFIDFVSLAIYFVDISMTMDKSQPHLGHINRSQLQFNFDNEDWEKDVSRTPTTCSNTNGSDKMDYVPYPDSSSVLRKTFTGKSLNKLAFTPTHAGQ